MSVDELELELGVEQENQPEGRSEEEEEEEEEDKGPYFEGLLLTVVNDSVTEMDLFNHRNMDSEWLSRFFSALKSNTSVTKLILGDTDVTADDMKGLCDALKSNSHVTWLDVSFNGLNADSFSHLSSLLSANNTLRHLDVAYNHPSLNDCHSLFHALGNNHGLQYIDFSGLELTREGCELLCQSLTLHGHITDLMLCSNNMDAHTLEPLALWLKKTSTLLHLDISSNCIGEEGCVLMMKSMMDNVSVTWLDIAWNQIKSTSTSSSTSSCAHWIGEMIVRNSHLKRLNLCGNDIGDEGVRYVCESLQRNTCMRYVDLTEIQGAHVHVANMMIHNTSLHHISVDTHDDHNGLLISSLCNHNGNITLIPDLDGSDEFTQRNKEMHEKTLRAVVHWLALKKYGKTNVFPKELMQIIAQHLWRTKSQIEVWEKKNQ